MGHMIKRFGIIFIALSLVLFISTLAVSQDFPKKSIRIIVPFGVGAGADTHTRRIQPYLEKYLGVSITVENKPAAAGRPALDELWSMPPDGYNMAIQGMPGPIFNELLYPVKYHFTEFTFLYAWSTENVVLTVNPEVYKTTDEFVSAARTKSVSGGTSGIKSVSHILGLILEEAAKFKPVNWVHYTGGSEPMAALAGKHIDFVVSTPSTALPLIKAGRVKAAIVFSNERDVFFPNATIPKELGLTNLEFTWSSGLRCAFAPPRMPPQIIGILENAFAKSVQEPGWRDWAEKAQIEINLMNHEQTTKFIIENERQILKFKDKLLK